MLHALIFAALAFATTSIVVATSVPLDRRQGASQRSRIRSGINLEKRQNASQRARRGVADDDDLGKRQAPSQRARRNLDVMFFSSTNEEETKCPSGFKPCAISLAESFEVSRGRPIRRRAQS